MHGTNGSPAPVVVWSVSLQPHVQADASWRARLLGRIHPEVRRRLTTHPDQRQMVLGNDYLEVTLAWVSGRWSTGAELRLQFQEPGGATQRPGPTAKAETSVVRVLPDPKIESTAGRLVGLEPTVADMILRLRCKWDGRLDQWRERTGGHLPLPLRAHLEDTAPLFVLHGDPGLGKSVSAQVAADRYCREAGISGRLYWLTTAARGNGLVNDFGNQLRAAFQAAMRSAETAPAFVIIDEADAVAMRRDEAHSHQEDRAGTATLLQALDELAGHRVAVFLTTNLITSVDAAVLRRGTSYEFRRPNAVGRRRLLEHWLPHLEARTLDRAATAARDMTPADIERSLVAAYIRAIREELPLEPATLIDALRAGERTRGFSERRR